MEFTVRPESAGHFDVIVCGSGVSGFAAAVTAARQNLKVALIEQAGCFGGVSTSSRVSHLLGGRRWDEASRRMIREAGGLFDELTDRLIASGGAVDPDSIDVNWNPFGWYPRMAAGIACDPEMLKCLYDDMIQEAHIEPFLFTRLVGVQSEGGRIRNAVLHNKSGFFSLSASLFVDATGDADAAFLAGCPVEKGREEDGLMTPATLIMHADNVDGDALVAYQNEHNSPKLVEIIDMLREKGIWDFPFDIFISIQLNDKDVFMVNTLRQVGIDGTKGSDMTRAMIEGRRDSRKLFSIMREWFPGFSNARIRLISDAIGIRETRRIIGRAHVKLEDALAGRRYGDEVAKTTYNFDLPDPLRPSYDPMMGNAAKPNAKREHQAIYVPYGVMVPQKIDNLICCGRIISVDREVLGPMRISGPAMMLGQAAGYASALAMKKDCAFPGLDGKEINSSLKQGGCIL
ncbi:FAD-dependent oxidoreductase [Treponema sp. OttesenSCG-928-L16]|nr:FAD-dependent oxidoreductase [Treponema sp. OttesenSCG-928-L16]